VTVSALCGICNDGQLTECYVRDNRPDGGKLEYVCPEHADGIPALYRIAQDINYEESGNSLRKGHYFRYSPEGKALEGQGTVIKIISGEFMYRGRLSNHWTWCEVLPDGTLADEKQSGCGGDDHFFCPLLMDEALQEARK